MESPHTIDIARVNKRAERFRHEYSRLGAYLPRLRAKLLVDLLGRRHGRKCLMRFPSNPTKHHLMMRQWM